jgi:hypothetical protein
MLYNHRYVAGLNPQVTMTPLNTVPTSRTKNLALIEFLYSHVTLKSCKEIQIKVSLFSLSITSVAL